jgi:hypothetical protein
MCACRFNRIAIWRPACTACCLAGPVLIDDDSDEKLLETDDPLDLSEFKAESEEDALARAIAEEQETDA